MQAVKCIIAAVNDALGSTGCVALDRAALQRCPGPALTRIRRHLPSMTSELLAAVAAAPVTIHTVAPAVAAAALAAPPVLGERAMPGAAKAAKAALECAVATSSLTAAPASAAAVSVSPTHSLQHSGGTPSPRLFACVTLQKSALTHMDFSKGCVVFRHYPTACGKSPLQGCWA